VVVWADDFRLLVENDGVWETVDDENMGFENGMIAGNRNDWFTQHGTFSIEVTDSESHSGMYSLKARQTATLFDKMPLVGEAIQESIGSNLYCYVPLTLHTTDGISTYPKTNRDELNRLKNELAKIDLYNIGADHYVAYVFIAWNVLQHFFPYMDVVDMDWEQKLRQTIQYAINCTDGGEFLRILRKMVFEIRDGAWVQGNASTDIFTRTQLLLFFDYIEGRIVVSASGESAFQSRMAVSASDESVLQIGDIVKTIDGRNAIDILYEFEQHLPGLPQTKRRNALLQLSGVWVEGTPIEILRNNEIHKLFVPQSHSYRRYTRPPARTPFNGIIELETGIFYVNASDYWDINYRFDELAEAKAVIFDFREDRIGAFLDIIPHLTEKPVSFPVLKIPQIIYPNRAGWTYKAEKTIINPEKPTFKSKIIVITPLIGGVGEQIIGLLDYYNLGVIVGSATAGSGVGRANFIFTIRPWRISFSGGKVLKHDGSQLYMKGYEPHYPVTRTLEAFLAGRDEHLEKALEIARRNMKEEPENLIE